jgi:hypothetical protein
VPFGVEQRQRSAHGVGLGGVRPQVVAELGRRVVRVEIPGADGPLSTLAEKLGAQRHTLTHRGQADNDAADAWLADRFGVPAMSRFTRAAG